MQDELRMKYVYDYMFHLLFQYAKLLKYQPTVPEGAMEVCSGMLICSTKGLRKKFRKHTMVNTVADSTPCILQPPFDQTNLQDHLKRKENLMKQVELWETSQDIRKE